MLINNPEALKSWLIVILEPLCDADSSALARYVLALLKKDKPEKELQRVMVEQLDVFLSDETKPFVERLFDAINTEEYLVIPSPPPPSLNAVAGATADQLNANATGQTTTQPSNVTAVSAAEQMLSTQALDEYKTKEAQQAQKLNSDVTERTVTNASSSASVAVAANNIAVSSYHELPPPPPAIHHVRSASPATQGGPRNMAATSSSALADKENQPRDSRRRRASLRSRSRSRSRSNERLSRRSRSRDRRGANNNNAGSNNNNGEREKNQRQFRNKSPPSSLEARHDRRRLGGAGGGGDRRGRLGADERSPRFVKGRHSRSRSPTPGMTRSRKSSAERHQQQQQQQQQLSHVTDADKRQRCRDFDEKGYCVRGETCPWDHGVNPVVFEDINNSALISISLREYNPDVPDLWSRGSAPSGTPNSAMLAANDVGIGPGGVAGGINPFTGTPRPGSVMMGGSGGGFPHMGGAPDKLLPNGGGPLAGADYTRSAAAANAAFRGAPGAPMIPFPFNPVATPLQRELIPIPVVDAGNPAGIGGDIGALQQQQQSKRRYELEDNVAIAEGPTHKRKLPLNSRLGPRMGNNMMQTNCSLELRKVPRGLNTIAHLNNHFAKFGKIVNIQISYDGDPEAAIITFSTHAEANVAYRSTEAVLNNRFIKVFWHSQDVGNNDGQMSMGNSAGGGGVGNMSGGGRKSSQYHLNNVPAVPTPTADSAKTFNAAGGASSQGADANATDAAVNTSANAPLAATHVPTPSLRLKNNVARPAQQTGAQAAANATSIRKKQEEQAKAVVQLANGLRKRKQELLQSYVKQMKSAVELVQRCEPQDAQRAKTLATIKMLQENIDKLHKEIAAEQEQIQQRINNNNHQGSAAGGPPPVKKTKEQQKKELLDIELELFAQQQEGNDTSAIQRRLEELQRSLGIHTAGSGLPHGAGGINPATGKPQPPPHFAGHRGGGTASARGGRGSYHNAEVSTRVDRRPKTIVVTGFTGEEADFVLGHFKHFGEISKHDVDKEIPQLILSYATRMSAEQAVVRGKIFKDKRLQICWAPTITPKIAVANTPLSDSSKIDADKLVAGVVSETDLPTIDLSKHQQHDMDLTAGMDTLPELPIEDEEEEEECEDRSWRR